MRFRHVRQPVGTNQCGQACMAMICGLKLKDVVAEMGGGKTRTDDLSRFLEQHGFYTYPPLERMGYGKVGKAFRDGAYALVVKVSWEKRSHWVVFYKGKTYDPIENKPKDGYVLYYPCAGQATSYLAVWKGS